MSTLSWGSGGGTGQSWTSQAGNGWYTTNIALPDARAIYDGTRPIRLTGPSATAGTGSRSYAYAVGSSGWITSGYHNISTSTVMSFRVVAASNSTIYVGIKTGVSGSNIYWVSGDLMSSGSNAVMPGQITYYQAPSAPTINSVTPSTTTAGSVTFDISGPSDNGGQSVTGYTYQVSSNSGFTSIVKEQTSSGDLTMTGLPVGTTLYVRVMAKNAVTDGVSKKGGAASATKSFSLGTAPVTAAGIAVSPSPAGSGATVTLSPPSNTGGLNIDSYEFEREYLTPPPIPSPAVVTTTTTSLTNNVSGLQPGASYRWRARARNAIGFGPWSAYTTVVQPAPSTNPGEFFDGNTTDTAETDFTWLGTANNSASTAQVRTPDGWLGQHKIDSNAERIIAPIGRQVGGLFGTYAAVANFWTDSASPGYRMGIGDPTWTTYYADVVEGSTYFGSIHVNPSRTQRMAATIVWYTSANAKIGVSTGVDQEVGSGVWTRLSVSAMAPNNAARAEIVAEDVAGTGWSIWRGGDTLMADGAMISLGELYPYFDGSTEDTTLYTYAWTGASNRSTSTRTQIEGTEDDPLADPDCVVPPAPPRPPTVPSDCIDEVGTWRRYWATIPATEISDWLTVLPTLEVTTRANDARQVRIRVYANPFGYPPEQLDTSEWCSEQIISYIPPNTIFTLDGVTQRAWAEVNGGSSLSADHLVYGTNGVPPTWPHLSCGISYLVSYDIPLSAPVDNFSTRVYLTQRT